MTACKEPCDGFLYIVLFNLNFIHEIVTLISTWYMKKLRIRESEICLIHPLYSSCKFRLWSLRSLIIFYIHNFILLVFYQSGNQTLEPSRLRLQWEVLKSDPASCPRNIAKRLLLFSVYFYLNFWKLISQLGWWGCYAIKRNTFILGQDKDVLKIKHHPSGVKGMK